MNGIFDAAFDAAAAWNQAVMVIIGTAFLLVGGFLFAWFFYTRMAGKKVRARLVGVRATAIGQKTGGDPVLPPPATEEPWENFAKEFKKTPGTGLAALLFAFLIVGIPLLFIGFGLWFGVNYAGLRMSGAHAEGVVVANEYHDSSEGGGSYYSVVSFRDASGQEWRLEDNIGKGGSPFYDIGEKVPVYYDPADPEDMVMGGALHNLILPMVFTGMGGLVLFILFAAPHLKRKPRPEGRPEKASYAGEMYYPVFEYAGPGGETVRAEGDTGSNWIADKIPGQVIHGYINPDNPETVSRPGFLSIIFGLVFAGPGAALLWVAFTRFEFNIFTVIIMAGLLAMTGFKVKKIVIPRELRPGKEAFLSRRREKRAAKRAEGRLLTPQEVRERVRAKDRELGMWIPFHILLAVAFLAGGVWLSRDMRDFVAGAERAPGEVVRLDSVYNSSSDGGSYTYYPVVEFRTASGEEVEFRDKAGSNPPLYSDGDDVSVLYNPESPRDALIDRGVWNWAAAGGCLLAGLLLSWAAVRSWAGLQRRARL